MRLVMVIALACSNVFAWSFGAKKSPLGIQQNRPQDRSIQERTRIDVHFVRPLCDNPKLQHHNLCLSIKEDFDGLVMLLNHAPNVTLKSRVVKVCSDKKRTHLCNDLLYDKEGYEEVRKFGRFIKE